MSAPEYAFPWERAAMRGEPMPEGLCLPEQWGYKALRQTYREFYGEALPREAASREKRLIVAEIRGGLAAKAFADKLTEHHVRVLRGAEAAKAACRKDPTPENALRLCDVLDGLERMEEDG